jgi:adenosylcobinamide-phosphate synthase
MSAAAMVVALATEGAFDWPDRLYRAIGNPVTWIGRLINHMDLRFNLPEDAPEEKLNGVASRYLSSSPPPSCQPP